jgi:hypothetical protein
MRKILVLLTTLVLLVGCGGDDDSESSDSTTIPPTTRPTAELDKQRAGRIVLTAADLPGYTEDTSPDEDDDEVDRAFAACVQNDPVLTAEEPENPRTVDGKDFDKGDELSVGSSATIAETQEQAQAAIAQLRNQTVLDCLQSAFRRELAASLDPGVTLRNVAVSALPVATAGDEAVGVRVAATLSAAGETVQVTSDVTAIRRERAVAFLVTNGVGNRFSNAEREALALKMADRMAP